jgi:SAM-dependent methyltransferase
MDFATFHALVAPDGQAVLAAAAALGPTEATFLRCFEQLRKRNPPTLAKAALETLLLREKARAKFSHADRMYFTREALEQASGSLVSRYRATRFTQFGAVLDLCCGIGADTIALAAAGCRVEARDWDNLRLAMARENVAAHGLTDRVRLTCCDVLGATTSDADAAFIDPSRRDGDRRLLDPNRYLPPLGKVVERLPAGFPLGAKVAPGVSRSDLAGWNAEAEFISADGELKECVLWFGPLRTADRRATVLPGPHTLSADDPPPDPPPVDLQEYVFDPDPAVIRAELVGLLAEQLDAVPVDHRVAVLTGRREVRSPFADCYRVEHAAPFHAGRLRDYLRARQVGRVTPLKRAVDLDVNEVMRKLKLDGPEHRHLILTRSLGRMVAVVAQKM